jgi:light-regulated signal transduction histidine kinase (bacteriophytochrome)
VANSELEAFSYSVAHDLRTPLRAVNGFAGILIEDYKDQIDSAGLEYLDKIRENTLRMSDLIDALLSLARVTRSEARPERNDLPALVRVAAAQLANADPDAKVELVVQDGLTAQMDPVLARTLLDNLVSNAWKFARAARGARIGFRALTKDGAIVFFVRDNGAGFDMTHAGRLFAPFQRLHAVREYPGTGIGLATSRRIIERHGGRIWAEGQVNRGATFFFSLPNLGRSRSAPGSE